MTRLHARFFRLRPPERRHHWIAADDWVWLMNAIHQLHQRPFDATAALRSSPPPFLCHLLPDTCDHFGLKLHSVALNAKGLGGFTFPIVAFLKVNSDELTDLHQNTSGHAAEASRPTAHLAAAVEDSSSGDSTAKVSLAVRPVLVVRGDDDRALFFRAGCSTPEVAPVSDLLAVVQGEGFLVRPSSKSEGQHDDFDASPEVFGYRWFLPEILKHRRLWLEVLVASLLIQLAGLAVPLLTQLVLDKVVSHRASSTLMAAAVGLCLFAVFSVSLSWARQYLVTHTGTRIDAVLGAQVFGRLMRLPLVWFESRTTGTVAARLQGIETIREFLCGAAVTLLLDLPFVTLYLAVMFWYSWQLSLLVVAVLMLVVLASLMVAPVLRHRADRHFLAAAQTQAVVTEHVSGIATIKSLQAEARVGRRFEDAFAASLQTGFETRQLSNSFGAVVSFLEHAMTIGVLVLGATLIMEQPGFTVGMLVAFQMFSSRLAQPVMRIASLWQEAQQAAVAVRRLRDLMDCPPEPYSQEVRRERVSRATVQIRELGFRYGPQMPWLFRGFSLSLVPGNLLVVTGPSGCGKSTLAGLLLGFRRPEEGCILIDGKDTRALSANELRTCFGVVPQDPVLFSGTVLENLHHADPGATFDDIVQACRAAEIHDFVEALPEGYRSRMGERGTGLSGGQKQRLAIAQALLKRAPVLVFDEATSALDADTANQLACTINRLKPHVAILFIAHHVPAALEVTSTIRLDNVAGVS
jgi:subfamily B ATP-binding cassette protein HlyB/CyaB